MQAEPKIGDPVVAVAIERLTEMIAYAHPDDVHLADARDRATLIEGLAKLARDGHELDPAEIAAWALENNWRPEDAEKLRDYAERTMDPRRWPPPMPRGFSRKRPRLVPDIVEHWRAEARRRGATVDPPVRRTSRDW